MDNLDITKQIDLSYQEQLNYLKEKYGKPQGNYFLNESFKSVNSKIKRGSEGLYLHHDMEWNPDDVYSHNLSIKDQAKLYPYSYQTSDYLTYCNLLEHLLLHVKIFKLRREALNNLEFIDGVECFLIPQINDIYATHHFKKPYLIATQEAIKDNYAEYLNILNMYAKIAKVEVDYLLTLTQR